VFRHTYEELVRALPPGVPVVLLGVPDMGAIPRFAQPLRAVAGWRGRNLDAEVRWVAVRTGAVYADIAGPTGPPFRHHPDRYFAADDFHPSDAGYGLWADAVLNVLRREGLPQR
jgi:lysophospholipase L1-like esterase